MYPTDGLSVKASQIACPASSSVPFNRLNDTGSQPKSHFSLVCFSFGGRHTCGCVYIMNFLRCPLPEPDFCRKWDSSDHADVYECMYVYMRSSIIFLVMISNKFTRKREGSVFLLLHEKMQLKTPQKSPEKWRIILWLYTFKRRKNPWEEMS